MARITEIAVSRSVKLNLGDYESTDLFTSMKVELEPEDDAVEERKKLVQTVERAMVAQTLAHLKARSKAVDRAYVIKRYGFGSAL